MKCICGHFKAVHLGESNEDGCLACKCWAFEEEVERERHR